ncbi:MAG: hypothetical protein ACR2PL_00580 [Dehalococcoidia bacterium]
MSTMGTPGICRSQSTPGGPTLGSRPIQRSFGFGLLLALLILFPFSGSVARGQYGAGAVVRSAAGVDAASIQAAVDSFRADLGGSNNGVGNPATSGRREINWDGVPDSVAAPNNLPANFFNANSPRGVVFSTPGSGFQVSANAAVGPARFGNINPAYPDTFTTFSPERLFTALDSTITDVSFFVSGTDTPASVSGFGVVFTNVRLADTTTIEYFDAGGTSLGVFSVPAGAGGGLSFLGVSFPSGTGIGRLRITSGNAALSAYANDVGASNLVVMDDFIYGEPVATTAAGS